MRLRTNENQHRRGIINFIAAMIIMSNTGSGFFRSTVGSVGRMNEISQLSESKVEFRAEAEPEDPGSNGCLSCHDGVIAGETHMTPGNGYRSGGPVIGMSHPVMINYSDSANRSPGKYTPVRSLDPRIRLFNEKIECLSCHDPDSGNQYYLVLVNERSRLCMSCHNL